MFVECLENVCRVPGKMFVECLENACQMPGQ